MQNRPIKKFALHHFCDDLTAGLGIGSLDRTFPTGPRPWNLLIDL
jgi:hypothetical protein